MNSGNIQLTQILGTDSISSSRIVINDNFKILASELENYKQYFDENGVYSSVILSKNEQGTIDFKIDESHSKMQVNSSGVTINGTLKVNNTASFDTIELTSLKSIANDKKLVISGNVEIQGDLSVSGNSPSGSETSQTILVQNISTLENVGDDINYVDFYNRGCYITSDKQDTDLNIETILKLVNNSRDNEQLLQYINKPIFISGIGIRIIFEKDEVLNRIVTNCRIANNALLPYQYTHDNEIRGIPMLYIISPFIENYGTQTPYKKLNIQAFTMPAQK